MFDYLVKYKLYNDRDIKDVLFCFVFETFVNRSHVYKKNVNWLAMLVTYFLINKYFSKKKMLEWLR